jgi:hypothetical protein
MLERLLAVALLLVAAPAAQARTVDVPHALRTQIAAAKTRSGVPVRLPARVYSPLRAYPGGHSRRGHYDLSLGLAKGCNEATACFLAAFLADRGAKGSGDRRVALAGGRRGWFTRTHCGASCAAPQVQWIQGGVLYTLQAKGQPGRSEQRALVALADSAIRSGPY